MHNTARLRRRILSHDAVVGVVGQGYVGLSLACAAADVGFVAIGLDIDAARVADLASGVLSVPGVNETLFQSGLASGRVEFTTDRARLATCDVILVCVPTPLHDGSPDLSYVEEACRQTAQHLTRGALVVLESTTYPGTTEERVQPILETSGLRGGIDFLLAYSPERIDPGNGEYGLRNTPKIVGGVTPEATGAAALFYEQLTEKVVVVSSCRAAELTKLLENAFRHVNIALANEMAMLCRDMENKDPVKRFEELLRTRRLVDEAFVGELDERIKREFDEGYEFAQSSPLPEPGDVTKGLWVEDGYWSSEPGRGGGTGA